MYSLLRYVRFSQENEATLDQESYCNAWVKQKQRTILFVGYLLAIVLHLVFLLAEVLTLRSDIFLKSGSIHFFLMTILMVGFAKRTSEAFFSAAMAVYLYAALLMGIWSLYYVSAVLQDNHYRTALFAIILAIFILVPSAYPGPSRGAVLHSFLVWLAFFAVVQSWTFAWIYALVSAIFVCLGWGLRLLLYGTMRALASAEYNLRIMILPENIVRRSMEQSESVESFFRAELKPCICVSSDWRNYQALSANLSPVALTQALDNYYTEAFELLRYHFPEGTFFADWIADEFFVVIYAENSGHQEKMGDAVLQFALDFLQMKKAFLETHGLPEAIDIGLASGESLIGLMGPQKHRKATAIGETPGRSRRMQSTGKLLRHELGECDRVIFGKDVLNLLSSARQTKVFSLRSNQKARDIEDRVFYHADLNGKVHSLEREAS